MKLEFSKSILFIINLEFHYVNKWEGFSLTSLGKRKSHAIFFLILLDDVNVL